jgi:UDP-N-acetylglucosamine acyltransferase
MPKISPKAIVENTAELADDVVVGPFAYIGPNVRIGPGCIIDNNATVTGRTILEGRNHVFPLAVVGAGADGSLGTAQCVIGEANGFREHVTVYGGDPQPTRIGSDNLVMIGCQLGASCVVGDHGIFANCTHVGALAQVENYVHTGGFAEIESGVTVGAYTFMAGYAQIDIDAPPYSIVQGFPFRVRGVNTEKLRRCGFGEEDIKALKTAFRELFDGASSRPDRAALQRMIDKPDPNRHVRRLVEFLIRQSRQDGGSADA